MTRAAKGFVLGPAHVGYVVTLLVAMLGQWEYSSRTIASLSKGQEDSAAQRAQMQLQRNREMDDVKSRLHDLERNCNR